MQGELADLPLIGVLELIHFSRKTGLLEVNAPIPFAFSFTAGEITEGGIIDWLGLDAIYTMSQSPERGRFTFTNGEASGTPLKPFSRLVGDWAHLADEWPRQCELIGSPSRVLRGDLPEYTDAGRSIRAVARQTGRPLFEVAQRAVEAVMAGSLEKTNKYAWHVLRIRHPRAQVPEPLPPGSIERLLDGQRNLGEVLQEGVHPDDLRQFLVREVRSGLRFPGAGWLLRDLTWELEHSRMPVRMGT